MITFRAKTQTDGLYGPPDWRSVRKYFPIEDCTFRLFDYKVNNTVFKRYSKKFEKAFEQHQIWEKLND